MGSSTSSTTVVARSSMKWRNRSSAISRIISADGIMTGGGVTESSATAVLDSVGDEMRACRAVSARTAFQYAPRSPTLSYSSMKEEVIFCRSGKEGKVMGFGSSRGSSFYPLLGAPSALGYLLRPGTVLLIFLYFTLC